MKFAPVTVSVNAAPPTISELGFREPDARDGLGLGGGGGGGGGVLFPPPHPTRYPTATTHKIAPLARHAQRGSPNFRRTPSTAGLEDTVCIFITPLDGDIVASPP